MCSERPGLIRMPWGGRLCSRASSAFKLMSLVWKDNLCWACKQKHCWSCAMLCWPGCESHDEAHVVNRTFHSRALVQLSQDLQLSVFSLHWLMPASREHTQRFHNGCYSTPDGVCLVYCRKYCNRPMLNKPWGIFSKHFDTNLNR